MIQVGVHHDSDRRIGEHLVDLICRRVLLDAGGDRSTRLVSLWEIVANGGPDDGKPACTMTAEEGSPEVLHAKTVLGENVCDWPGKRARMLCVGSLAILTTIHPIEQKEEEEEVDLGPRRFDFRPPAPGQWAEASVLPSGNILLVCKLLDGTIQWQETLTPEKLAEKWTDFLDVPGILRMVPRARKEKTP